MRRFVALFAVFLILSAGCVQTGKRSRYEERLRVEVVASGIEAENRTSSEYYFVLIRGGEQAQRVKGQGEEMNSHCDYAWSFGWDEGRETLQYDPARYDIDLSGVKIVIATQYLGVDVADNSVEECGGRFDLRGYNQTATFVTDLRSDLPVRLDVYVQNGFVTFNQEYFVHVGNKVVGEFNRVLTFPKSVYNVTGSFEVVNLGAWPRTSISPGY